MATPHAPTVDDLPFDREIITIDAQASVVEGFKVLVKNKILSVPVYDADKKTFIGFFDVSDFATFAVDVVENQREDVPMEFCDLQELVRVVSTIHPKKLGDVLGEKPADKGFQSVAPGTSLEEVLRLLSDGLHRVPVVNDKGKIVKIVSQSAVTKFLEQHASSGLLKTCGSKTVAESDLGRQDVVTISQNDPAIGAIKLLLEKEISGCVVVDEEGVAVTSLSLSDLRTAVSGPPFKFNNITALELVQHSRSLDGACERPAIVQVHRDTTLRQVVGRLAATGLHRVYVLDAESKPAGVISLKDVLKHALQTTTD
eukprot:m.476868 g.476868  ORF g.476868 m.476868 type:complete len:313 (-) comp20684_c0_seq1:154-1092(-)